MVRDILWKIPENKEPWRYKLPDDFKTIPRPLYKEVTFLDLQGKEKIKITDG